MRYCRNTKEGQISRLERFGEGFWVEVTSEQDKPEDVQEQGLAGTGGGERGLSKSAPGRAWRHEGQHSSERPESSVWFECGL